MNQLRPLVIAIVLLAAIAYVGGILYAGIQSIRLDAKPDLPQVITQAITVIGGALATHFGAIFGISQYFSGNPRRQARPWEINQWARATRREDEPEQPTLSLMQVAAAYLYVGSLVLAVVFWGIDGFSENSADILRNMTSTLIGVFAGILAVALNFKK